MLGNLSISFAKGATIMIADNQQEKSVLASFGYVLGVYLSDGCVYQGPYGSPKFTMCVIDKDFVEHTLDAIEGMGLQNFNKNINMIRSKGIDTYRCQVVSRRLCTLLIDATNNKQSVPRQVLSRKDVFLPFLAGLMDGDGWISKRKNPKTPLDEYSQIAISAKTSRYSYLNDLPSGLDRFGFKYRFTTSPDVKYGGEQSTINFNKKSFIENGGTFTIQRKLNRLQKLAALYGFPQRPQ